MNTKKTMNLFLKIIFIVVIISMFSAAILQIFYPERMGANSEYGISIGWQREIGFWNLAVLPILLGVLYKYDYFFLKIAVISLIVGGLGFGTNHLIGYLADPTKIISLTGAIQNYLLVVFWFIGLKIEKGRQ